MQNPQYKRMVGRVTGACSHTVPVLVPCLECVERQLASWEQAIRLECLATLTDDMKYAKENAAKWKAEVATIMEANVKLSQKVEDLKRRNGELTDKLKDVNRRLEDAYARLHAEQAVIQGRAAKMVSDL